MGKERWAGAIDSVGSHTLANALSMTRYGGTVAACGLAQGMDFPADEVSFFLSRQRFLPARKPTMSLWRQKLFAVLMRNTLGATAYFRIPPSQVVELGSQVQF